MGGRGADTVAAVAVLTHWQCTGDVQHGGGSRRSYFIALDASAVLSSQSDQAEEQIEKGHARGRLGGD